MLPPDTDEIVSTSERMPSSWRRRSAPRWNKALRNPPPERQIAISCRGSPRASCARLVGDGAGQGKGKSRALNATSACTHPCAAIRHRESPDRDRSASAVNNEGLYTVHREGGPSQAKTSSPHRDG